MEYLSKRKKYTKQPLTQRQILKNIQESKNIIITEADTGSTIVILNKTYYGTKIQEILRDETNYKLIDTNIDNYIISKITKFCKTHNETKKEIVSLSNYIPKTTNFYGLTNIPKSKEMKKSYRNTKI